jgi:nucleotide-binding universal stress UspA family protein
METNPDQNVESGNDSRSFAAQLAGGDGEYVVPEEKPQKVSRTTLAFAGMAVLAGGGLFLMKQRAGPASASAGVATVDTAAQNKIKKFLAGGASEVEEVETLLADSEMIRERFVSQTAEKQVPLGELKTNPFWREQQDAEAEQAKEVLESEAYAARLAAERERLRREAKESLQKDVARVRVDLVLLGSRPTCQINGQFLRVGDSVDDLLITAITDDGVTLRRGENEAVATIGR